MKFYSPQLTKKIILIAAIIIATAAVGFGQVSITDNTPKVTNFNSWNGTLPSGWVTGGPSASTTYRGTSATTTGGVYAVAGNGFGYLPSSSASSLTLQGTFQNNTGAVITSLRISYVAFKINTNTRVPAWSVTSTLGSVSGLNWTYNATSSAATPDSLGVILTGLNITDGATFTLTYASDRGTGSGSSPMIALNRVTVTNLTPSAPLFIRLNEFKVVNHGSTNDLSWTTATEETGDMFEVERSIDGKKFMGIASISANGSVPSAYQFTDQNPASGTNYYRLKLLNSDESIYYSNIVSANVSDNKESEVTAYPNPMTDKLNIVISGEVTTTAELLLLDGLGRICYHQTVVKAGIININTSQLASGTYFIKYFNTKGQKVIKIVK